MIQIKIDAKVWQVKLRTRYFNERLQIKFLVIVVISLFLFSIIQGWKSCVFNIPSYQALCLFKKSLIFSY